MTNARGQALLEAFSSLDLVLLNSGNTFTFRKGPAGSVVDLTFVSCCLAKGNNRWRVSEHYTNSDHQAVLWKVMFNPRNKAKANNTTKGVKWRVKTIR